MMGDPKTDAVLGRMILALAPGIGPRRAMSLVEFCGGVREIFSTEPEELSEIPGLSPEHVRGIFDPRIADQARGEVERAEREGVRILTPDEPAYPRGFFDLPDPPQVIYVKGSSESGKSIAIVGTRMPSVYGLRHARRFAGAMASAGGTVVSGLARGIDQASHEGALEAEGRTVAFLGSGILRIYPEENVFLAKKIQERGALISEFTLDEEARPFHFPQRNRLMAAMADAVLVVEAPRKSGALITVDCALDLGRDVFVIPGAIHTAQAAGSNELLKDGAICVTAPEDILHRMRCEPSPPRSVPQKSSSFESSSPGDGPPAVLEALEGRSRMSIDEIAARTGLSVPEVMTQLTEWESRGRVSRLGGAGYRLKSMDGRERQ